MRALIFLTLAGLFYLKAGAQDQQKQDITQMVESKQFTFKANMIMPMRGRSRPLIPEYELTILNDSISAYLPYIGRSYSPSLDPSELAIDLNTKDFSYSMQKAKRDGWDITIKPKNNRNVSVMELHISSTGYADLQVNSNIRQAVAYSGYITGISTKNN